MITFECEDDNKHLVKHEIHKNIYRILVQWIRTTENGRLPILKTAHDGKALLLLFNE